MGRARIFPPLPCCPPPWQPRSLRCAAGSPPLWQRQALFPPWLSPTTFHGATALAILYPILVWSVWLCQRPRGIWLRAVSIPLAACGLSAFWLSPSYVKTTERSALGLSAGRQLFAMDFAGRGSFLLFVQLSHSLTQGRANMAGVCFRRCGDRWPVGARIFRLRPACFR